MSTKPLSITARGAATSSSSDAPLATLKSGRSQQSITWNDAEPQRLLEVVGAISEAGGLVSFSKTSDGGAVCLYVKWRAESEKFYAASVLELSDLLEEVQRAFAEL